MPKITEFHLHRAVVIHLTKYALPDVLWWHTPNGGTRRDAFEGKRLKELGVQAGIFDLQFLRAGRFYALELKDERGRLSDAQLAMWQRYARAGVAADAIAWANNLAAARAQMLVWGLISC